MKKKEYFFAFKSILSSLSCHKVLLHKTCFATTENFEPNGYELLELGLFLDLTPPFLNLPKAPITLEFMTDE